MRASLLHYFKPWQLQELEIHRKSAQTRPISMLCIKRISPLHAHQRLFGTPRHSVYGGPVRSRARTARQRLRCRFGTSALGP